MLVGYHASHEQLPPAQLLADVQAAEQAGFAAAMCSDHSDPWSRQQGHAGSAWVWLGAACATTDLPFGVVTAPGQRQHPALVAQTSATLAAMFPGRFWMALGSGENLNEHLTAEPWPDKETRQRRLEECFAIIRRLHAGEEVTHHGLVRVDRARVWDLPSSPPPLIIPALTPTTAAPFADQADGLITVNQPRDDLAKISDAYRDNDGPGPLIVQVHLSWAPTLAEAHAIAWDQWRTNVFDPPVMADLATPEHFEAHAETVTPEQLNAAVHISHEMNQHAEWLHSYRELGVDAVYLHHVGKDQQRFIAAFADHVLPQLR